eukprot:176981-Amphidinium_carterae.1
MRGVKMPPTRKNQLGFLLSHAAVCQDKLSKRTTAAMGLLGEYEDSDEDADAPSILAQQSSGGAVAANAHPASASACPQFSIHRV